MAGKPTKAKFSPAMQRAIDEAARDRMKLERVVFAHQRESIKIATSRVVGAITSAGRSSRPSNFSADTSARA